MKNSQKIKNLIINLVCILIFSSILIFSFVINPAIYGGLLEKRIISTNNNLIVHFISVGQGDAIAINLPDGKVVLIDTGLEYNNVDYTKYIENKVLNTDKDKVVDYLILTHADTDHTGGALRLLQTFEVDNVIMPVIDGDTEYYNNLLNFIETNKIDIKSAKEIEISTKNYKFEFFIGEESLITNEMSHIIKFTCFGKSFLFTGDITSDVERYLISKYSSVLDCDILKVAHHGSKYSSCDEFLEIVSPEVSVISCGKNSYGHPTSEAISNIKECGSKLYRTDTDGHVAIILGDYYNLDVVCGEFKTVASSFNIQIFILIIDAVFIVDILIILLKKRNRNYSKM